jgi:bifunctional UDP-N-acetylglucosamine pyrophosphorylase/glucosamine-1-phosphate N-acetyltransferase
VPDPEEALGINDRRQLAEAARVMRRRLLDDLMLSGVTIEDPGTTYVDAGVSLGPDSVVRPMTILAGATSLGRQCSIGPMAQLRDVRGGDRVAIGASVLESCELGDDVSIGHFNRVRPDSVLDSGVSLGTHAEVKNSRVGSGTQIGHFSCILDSDVGRGVNIGAGTVTCNYDGADKHRTAIDDEVFVGSDSILVAPLHIGAGAYIAAGSVITDEVSAGALAIERTRQRTIEGWTSKRRPRGATTAR